MGVVEKKIEIDIVNLRKEK